MLPGALAFIMAGMGMSLEFRDFVNILRYPRSVFIGILCQLLVLPALTILLFSFVPLDPSIKVGFVIITACAGGAATNLITHLLKGNVALSISLTAVNSLLVLISLPFVVNLGLYVFMGEAREIHLPVWSTVSNILFTVIIPTLLGLTFRYFYPRVSMKIEGVLKYFMIALLFIVFVVLIFFDKQPGDAHFQEYIYLIPWALLLNFLSMFVVYLTAYYSRLGGKNTFTLSIEVGLKNSIIGVFVARSLLQNYDMTMVSVVYGSFTFFSTTLFGYLLKRFEWYGGFYGIWKKIS
jgi:BASS family bile acid:Na+ symporter